MKHSCITHFRLRAGHLITTWAYFSLFWLKFRFSKKATKFDEISWFNWHLFCKCQIFKKTLLKKPELYQTTSTYMDIFTLNVDQNMYAFLTTYPPNLVYVVFKRLLFKLSLLDVFFFRYYQVFSFLAITANFLFSLLTKLQLVLYSTFLFDHQKVLIVPRSIFRNLLSLDIKICQNASVWNHEWLKLSNFAP